MCTPRTIWPAPPGASCSLSTYISNCMSFLKPAGVRIAKFLGSSSRLMSMILSMASDMTCPLLRDERVILADLTGQCHRRSPRPRFRNLPCGADAIIAVAARANSNNNPRPQRDNSGGARADRREKPPSHPGRSGDADGRAPAPLLDADRRREPARQQSDQAHSPHGRGPRALQGPGRTFRAPRPPLPAPPRGPLVWIRRRAWHPLQLPRLADGRGRALHRAALRRPRQPAFACEGALHDPGLSGEGMRGPVVDLYGSATGAGAPGVGTVHLGEWLSRDRALRCALQLVPVPGELLRPRALRMDARQLEPSPQRQGGALRRQAPEAQVRGIRLRFHLQAGA